MDAMEQSMQEQRTKYLKEMHDLDSSKRLI